MNQASAVSVQSSFVGWVLSALGPKYAILLPLAGILAFIFVLIIVTRGRGPMAIAALIFLCAMPVLIGMFGCLEGIISTYRIIAMADATPKPSELAEGISASLVAPMAGMLFMAPSFAVAAIGSFFRSLSNDSKA